MSAIRTDFPDLPPLLDQAILDPLLNDEQLHELCDASCQEDVRAICTTPQQLPLLRKRLGSSDRRPNLIAAIGFPFGAIPSELKQAEAEWAASQGAEEFDVVPNFRALANGAINVFADELGALCGLGLPLRVILDMVRLNQDQLAVAVEASIDAGATGVQTGNGFGPACHPDQVLQLVALCRERCVIKAAGGIHSIELIGELVKAGAGLLGTSSAPQLLRSLRQPVG
ncbi:deoxyribose-phosphate aldolase [Synechococcus sp. M16CYN]|uniref:deoxyribose-phosphate aldolase n=1 Tax=Synechococcus sp. M16CYN TaxID=3103139 RepID=UPI00324F073E